MSVVYRIEHDTRYRYGQAVPTSRHVACLRPRELQRQHVLWSELQVDPLPERISSRLDYFGNTAEHFTLLRPHRELLVRAVSLVEVLGDASPPDTGNGATWEEAHDAFVYRKGEPGREEAEFTFPSPYILVEDDSREYASASFPPGRPLLAAAVDLMHRMHEDFRFDPDATTVTTPVSRVLSERRGVCQDLAHVMISCFRAFGLPARYVSGYVLTDPPPGQARLLGADASHAWVSVHCPGSGWVDLDPTNDVMPDTRHVVVGWGRDYGDVCPLRGVFVGGAEHQLVIGVSVIPLDDADVGAALRAVVSDPPLDFGGGRQLQAGAAAQFQVQGQVSADGPEQDGTTARLHSGAAAPLVEDV
jgi:transglutaminase-like putative cysteine protease